MESVYLVFTCRKMYVLWSLCPLYLHAERCTFVESVDLVFTPMNDVPFVEFKYLVFTCGRLYLLSNLCTLYLLA